MLNRFKITPERRVLIAAGGIGAAISAWIEKLFELALAAMDRPIVVSVVLLAAITLLVLAAIAIFVWMMNYREPSISSAIGNAEALPASPVDQPPSAA